MHFESKLQNPRVECARNEARRSRAALASKVGRINACRCAGTSNARIKMIDSVKRFEPEFNLSLLADWEDPGNGHIHIERPR